MLYVDVLLEELLEYRAVYHVIHYPNVEHLFLLEGSRRLEGLLYVLLD